MSAILDDLAEKHIDQFLEAFRLELMMRHKNGIKKGECVGVAHLDDDGIVMKWQFSGSKWGKPK